MICFEGPKALGRATFGRSRDRSEGCVGKKKMAEEPVSFKPNMDCEDEEEEMVPTSRAIRPDECRDEGTISKEVFKIVNEFLYESIQQAPYAVLTQAYFVHLWETKYPRGEGRMPLGERSLNAPGVAYRAVPLISAQTLGRVYQKAGWEVTCFLPESRMMGSGGVGARFSNSDRKVLGEWTIKFVWRSSEDGKPSDGAKIYSVGY